VENATIAGESKGCRKAKVEFEATLVENYLCYDASSQLA
jgi:hypothetical protein